MTAASAVRSAFRFAAGAGEVVAEDAVDHLQHRGIGDRAARRQALPRGVDRGRTDQARVADQFERLPGGRGAPLTARYSGRRWLETCAATVITRPPASAR